MPLPTTYSTGTASVANGATTLTIVGAVSNAIYAGDFFMDPAQPLVPPQRIASVTGGGVYELAVGWPGTTLVAAPYEVRITPDSVRVQERTRAVLEALDQRGLPQGGDAGQVLAKVTGDDYDVAWVDDAGGGGTAVDVSFSPAGGISATNVQAAVEELDSEKQAASANLTALAAAFTPASGTTAAGLALAEDTDNGTNVVTVKAPATLTADRSFTLPDATGTALVGSVGATDNRLVRSDGTGSATVQSSGITVDDNDYVSGIDRLTLDQAPTYDLASGALGVAMLIPLSAGTLSVAASKQFNGIRFSQTNGGDLAATVGSGGTAVGVYTAITAASGSDVTSNVYGMVAHATNAGPGTTRGLHGGGYGATGSTGVLNAVAGEITPVSTQGFTSAFFASLNSSGVHDKAIGFAAESGNADRYLVAFGNGVAALPIGSAYFRAWMATASSTNARAFQLLNNAGSEIQAIAKDGTALQPLGAAATPSVAFLGDTNTGVYSPGADNIAFSTGGTHRTRINSSGVLVHGNSTGTQVIGAGESASFQGFIGVGTPSTGPSFLLGDTGAGSCVIGGFSNHDVVIRANNADHFRLTTVGNVKIGGSATRATTEGTNQLVLFNGTAPAGTLTNGASIYAAAGELRAMDAAGNSTLLSPHDHETNEWVFDSLHTPSGKRLRIDVERLLRALNDRFGWDFVHEFVEASPATP